MQLSEEDVRVLAEQLAVDVDDDLQKIQNKVTKLLSGIERLDDVPISAGADEFDDRTWREPNMDEDPHNAVAHFCTVEPTDSGPLDGYDVGVKDTIAVAGIPMECASEVMAGYTARVDATAISRLLADGATVTAKSNLDELAGTGNACPPMSGPIQNPHDTDRIAGGSSGGSAVLVATNQVDIALGTETGGSVRVPAAFCGVVGLKPTYGLVPLTHIVEHAHSLDHVGVMARSVEDVASALESMAGRDSRDAASLQAAGKAAYQTGGYSDAVSTPPNLEDVTIGVLTEGLGDGVIDAVETRTLAAVDDLADAGTVVRKVSVESFEFTAPIFGALSLPELTIHWRDAGAPYRRNDIVDEDFQAAFGNRTSARSGSLGWQYKSRLLAGMAVIDDDFGRRYSRAQAARKLLKEDVETVLEDVDVLVSPTVPGIAPPIRGEADEPINRGRNAILAAVTGLPAITLPNGTVDGLPVGLQITGKPFTEAHLLGVSAAFDQVLERPEWAG